jgi:hypothetical protein
MNRNVLLSVALVAATGLLGGCDSVSSLNPFSPDGGDDLQPSFAEFVPNQTWTVGDAVHMSLPAASGGNPPLAYGLSPDLPAGLTFDAAARTIAGTPTTVESATTYVYSATDDDDDTASIQFQASVAAASSGSQG